MRLSLQIATCFLSFIALNANIASAQSVSLSRDIYQTTSSLNANQQDQLNRFVETWSSSLTSEDPSEALNARKLLIEPAENINSTKAFLRAYADALQPVLSNLVDGENSLHAENALRVAAFLRTPRMLTLIVEQINPDQTKDQYRRLVAAGLIHIAIEPSNRSGIDSGELTALARTISTSANKETNWHTLLQDLRSLSIITNSPILSEPNRITAREIQFQTFIDIANKVANSDKPSPLMNAVYRAMLDYNATMDNSEATEQTREAAKTLRKVIAIIGDATIRQWDNLKKGSPEWKAYNGVFLNGAQILQLMEGRRTPMAWELDKSMEKNKSDFQMALTNFKNN